MKKRDHVLIMDRHHMVFLLDAADYWLKPSLTDFINISVCFGFLSTSRFLYLSIKKTIARLFLFILLHVGILVKT